MGWYILLWKTPSKNIWLKHECNILCKLNFKNPLVLNSNGWYSSNTYIDKNINDIVRWKLIDDNDCVISYDFQNDSVNHLYKFILIDNWSWDFIRK